MNLESVGGVLAFFVFIALYQIVKRIFKWGLTYNYKHDKESLKASREFVKFQK